MEITMEIFEDMVKKGTFMVESLGYSVPKLKLEFMNKKKTNGQCEFRGSYCIIRLSKNKCSVRTEQEIFNTVVHELAHSVLPSHEGHGARWKLLADKLNRKYGLNITTYASITEEQIEYMSNHLAVCQGCGQKHYGIRLSNFMKSVKKANGSSCGWKCKCDCSVFTYKYIGQR